MSQRTKELDPKLIERQNQVFHRLSKKQQRIAIAKDVLKQIKLKRYKAQPDTYVNILGLRNKGYNLGSSSQFQEALLTENPSCNVCGIGAAFCSMARLGDGVNLWSDYHDKLLAMFSRRQVYLIEAAFEGKQIRFDSRLSSTDQKSTREFYRKYSKSSDRLAAIFRNILRNEGTFKP